MQTLLIATKNPGKLLEIKKFLSDLPLTIVSFHDVGITEDVEESGKTYQENAEKKALFYAQKSGLPAIADDGGLEITALNNEPGVKSHRWLGYKASDEELMNHMTKVAKKLSSNNRKAAFVVSIALALPNGKVWSAREKVEGIIPKHPYSKPMKGYPYRSFFYLPKIKKYYHESELTDEEQKLYNHRRKAVEKLKPLIRNVILGTFVALLL